MLIRFVITERDSESHQKLGVFQAAYNLLRSEQLGSVEMTELRGLLDWFKENLPSPPKPNPRAIFWFKSNAEESTKMIWQLVRFLEEQGIFVELIKTERPGYVIYEDKFQVAAIPFKDTMSSVSQ